MAYTYRTQYWNDRRNSFQMDTYKFDDVGQMLKEIANDFNAPRINGYIPEMTVAIDGDDVTVEVHQNLSAHMKKKLGFTD